MRRAYHAKFMWKFILSLFIGDTPSRLISLRGGFYSSPLGQLLKLVFEDKNIKEEAAMNYLNDFLHMMYKPIVVGELQVTMEWRMETENLCV